METFFPFLTISLLNEAKNTYRSNIELLDFIKHSQRQDLLQLRLQNL